MGCEIRYQDAATCCPPCALSVGSKEGWRLLAHPHGWALQSSRLLGFSWIVDRPSFFDLSEEWLDYLKKQVYYFNCPETKLLVCELIADSIRWCPAHNILVFGVNCASPAFLQLCNHLFMQLPYVQESRIWQSSISQGWNGCWCPLLCVGQCWVTGINTLNIPYSPHFDLS